MADSPLHTIVWRPRHGHPVLLYREAGNDRCWSVSVSTEEVRLLTAGAQGGC